MIRVTNSISMRYSIDQESRLLPMPVTEPMFIPQEPSQRFRVYFFDTTLRDGEQSPGCTMHAGEKLRLAHQIASLGVHILEAGFALASDGESESLRTIAREIRGPI